MPNAGTIGLDVMDRHPRLPCWLNDADPAIAALWEATRTHRTELIERVRDFEPKVAAFDLFQRHIYARAELPETAAEMVEFAFHQLAVSMTRWSGCGGGPRGGYDQHHPRIGERWSKKRITGKVGAISLRLKNARITNIDFAPLIEDTSRHSVLFIDPPYFDKKLYRYDFNLDDHERLADLLRQTPHDWLLTYEDHPAVWELYEGWATIKPLYKSRWIDTLAISNRLGAI
jgi:DNA adenine methylase